MRMAGDETDGATKGPSTGAIRRVIKNEEDQENPASLNVSILAWSWIMDPATNVCLSPWTGSSSLDNNENGEECSIIGGRHLIRSHPHSHPELLSLFCFLFPGRTPRGSVCFRDSKQDILCRVSQTIKSIEFVYPAMFNPAFLTHF